MTAATNFIRQIIDRDLEAGKRGARIHTRFPPEPNGCLHIGHAKSICLNFGAAADYKGICNLRFDDTNPETENIEYVNSIKKDIRWLGFTWGKREFYASDYFEKLYEYAVELIRKKKAYICDLSIEKIREYRGTVTRPGKESPCRGRTTEENVDLFDRMKKGEFKDGARVLRAKIDMANPNMLMRDPILYRIRKMPHYRTANKWCIYPTYDFTHCLSDSIEGITHSLCTLEFDVHRALYDWILDQLQIHHPRQIEFARLNLSHTVLSKRKLLFLVEKKRVNGWDDPRMPTIAGFRRRGYTPKAIRNFCSRIGVTKVNGIVEASVLENSIREELNKTAPRVMAVLNPVKVIIDNYPEGTVEELDAVNNPEDAEMGTRKVPFSRVLYIERDDFREEPPGKFFRLAPGREVRLRYAYFVKCVSFVKDKETKEIREIHCTYDPATRGGDSPDGRKVKGTIHWVSAGHASALEARLYGCLFTKRDPNEPEEGRDFTAHINPDSLRIVTAQGEPSLKNASPGNRFQFERMGYFFVDTAASQAGGPVFNRIATLRDTWAKIRKAAE